MKTSMGEALFSFSSFLFQSKRGDPNPPRGSEGTFWAPCVGAPTAPWAVPAQCPGMTAACPPRALHPWRMGSTASCVRILRLKWFCELLASLPRCRAFAPWQRSPRLSSVWLGRRVALVRHWRAWSTVNTGPCD